MAAWHCNELICFTRCVCITVTDILVSSAFFFNDSGLDFCGCGKCFHTHESLCQLPEKPAAMQWCCCHGNGCKGDGCAGAFFRHFCSWVRWVWGATGPRVVGDRQKWGAQARCGELWEMNYWERECLCVCVFWLSQSFEVAGKWRRMFF